MIFLVYFLLIQAGKSAESNSISATDDPGTCICDLTEFSCDMFCCCDPDCAQIVLDVWGSSCALERLSNYSTVYCVDSSELYKKNDRRGLARTNNSDEACFEVDVETTQSFYTLVSTVSESQVSERISDSYTYSNSSQFFLRSTGTSYSPEDIISEIAIFVPDPYGNCVLSGVEFLTNFEEQTCVQSGTLSDLCGSNLSTDYLKYSASVNSVLFKSDTGVETSASVSTQTSYSSGVCSNAVVEAHYTITTDSAQSKVSSLTVDYVLSTISSSDPARVGQKFSVKFFTSSSVTETSGNPGYIKGKPLLVLINSSASSLSFTGKLSSGECSDLSTSGPVLAFGTNTVFSCYYSKTFDELSSYCSSSLDTSKEKIFSGLSDLSQIGKWGSSLSSNSDDWISVTSSSSGTSASMTENVCSLDNTLVFNIYYAFLGKLDNPQHKIVYAEKFYQAGKWSFAGPDPSQAQKFLLNVVVNYVPYSTEYDPFDVKPRTDKILPQKVLYPFRSSFGTLLAVLFLEFI